MVVVLGMTVCPEQGVHIEQRRARGPFQICRVVTEEPRECPGAHFLYSRRSLNEKASLTMK
jgi:hypothetical protein